MEKTNSELQQEIISLRIAGQKLECILKNIRNEIDYLPDHYYEWIDKVFNETEEIISGNYDYELNEGYEPSQNEQNKH